MHKDDPRHGTHNGYGNLGCRCDPCKAAQREYNRVRGRAPTYSRRYRARLAEQGLSAHGTPLRNPASTVAYYRSLKEVMPHEYDPNCTCPECDGPGGA